MRPSPVYAAAAAGAATAVAVLHRRRQARFFSSARGGFGRRVWSGGKSSPAPPWLCFAGEGPSCLFVGPIETASKEMLEALYDQARDSYYSGKPLIVDDMFDKVELKLRLYGSKCVVKYPRCSLRRQSAYADAEEDPSQVFTLASIWILLFAFGSFIFLIPTLYTIIMTYGDAMDESFFLNNGRFQLQCLHMLNTPLFMGLGFLIGYPIASASSQALKGLWRNDLVALKSSCPNCGEEVFAFVRAKQSNQEPHRAECHVCESSLVFRTNVEESISRPGKRWVYGRVYLVPRRNQGRQRRIIGGPGVWISTLFHAQATRRPLARAWSPRRPPWMGLPELMEAAGLRQQQLVLCLLRSPHKPKTSKHLKRLHALVILAGLHRISSFAVGNLVSSCASLGLMSYALCMFEQMPHANSFVWNTLTRGLQQNRRPEDALHLFGAMRVRGVALDCFSFLNAVRTCTDLRDLRRGRCVHGQLLKSSVGFDVRLGSSLIEFYSVCGDMRWARKVFDGLPLKDAISWTVTIAGYVNPGVDMESARDLFEEMPAKDLVAWSTMIGGYVKFGDMGTARKLFDRSPSKDLLMKNMMLGGYAKTGEINNLIQLFAEMDERDVVSWNTAITGLVGCRRIHEAMELFHRMHLEDHRPNEVTLAGILSGCAQVGALDTGRWIHSYIDKNSYVLDSMVGTALVDMYSKCGELESARYVFAHMVERDVAAWNAMITGSYTNGHSNQAVDLFRRMRSEEALPNDVTMVAVLSACAHAGLVDEGRRCFDSMQRELAVVPKIEHYGCMVDLLGRAGLLHEAFEFIQRMPLPPHTGVWGALLGACKIHGNVELAEQAVEHLVELDPEDGGYMAIMCNIYADAGRWADVSRLRDVMRKKGVVKVAGCSSVEIDGAIHEFGAGDKTHPRHHEIYEMVDMISLRLLTAGNYNLVEEALVSV